VNKLCWLFIAAAGLSAATGCGGGDDATTVSGTVIVAGQTMGEGALNFFPVGGDRPIGTPVSADGTYSQSLPPGDYSVVVVTSTMPPEGWKEGDPLPPPKVKVPQKYAQPRSTPLKLAVGADDMTHDFELE
jgi:hypothetical protein